MKNQRFATCCILFFVLGSINLFSQGHQLNDLVEKHKDFFTSDRENFHIHLNKTSFLNGEHIWLKAYIYDQNAQRPSTGTSNLYVSIFDSSGKKIEKKLLYIENGVGTGHFEIDGSFAQGEYYIKAYTNWMKNFENPNSFYQKIQVLGSNSHPETILIATTDSISVQLFPENGYILQDTKNTVGFKISDKNGFGREIEEAFLVQDDGAVLVKSIAGNVLGFGKFTFMPKKDVMYSLRVELKNGIGVEQKLPKSVDKGVLLSVNTLQPEKLLLTVNTNERTLNDRWGDIFYMAFHKNKYFAIEEFVLQDSVQVFEFYKNKLPFGVNTVTLFDSEFRPIAARMIFNESGQAMPDVDISKVLGISSDFLCNYLW